MSVSSKDQFRCVHCGSIQDVRPFNFAERRGLLFIDYNGTDRVSPYWKALCGACWAKWLMWKAQLGFDLHTHAAEKTCDNRCLARRAGRQLQFMALQHVFLPDRTTGFWVAKTIDGMPGVNGSTQLAALRVLHFVPFGPGRQSLYESLKSVEEFQAQIRETARLHASWIPVYALDQYMFIFEVFRGAHTSVDGRIKPPTPGEPSLGLHAVFVTGYSNSGDTIHFVNSWGPSWGNRGYGTVSVDYLARYFREAWVVRSARWGLTPSKFKRITPGTDAKELRRLWLLQNPRLRWRLGRLSNGHWRGGFYETVSPQEHCPVECLEVRNGFGLRMGWSFVYHLPGSNGVPPFTEIRELFVWPAFRRMHIGTELETWAAERAVERGSEKLRTVLNEGDATAPGLAPAIAFGEKRGYEWRWVRRVGPRAVATGTKQAFP